jgi:YD repeat-containing protein
VAAWVAYDLLGNRTQVTDDQGQTTVFVYDDFGRLGRKIDPVVESPDQVDRFFYDEADNLILAIDRAGRTTMNSYDVLNRLVERSFTSEGKVESIAYDDYGNVESLASEEVAYTFDHDEKRRLRTRTDSRFGRTLGFEYDAADRVLRKTDYQGDVTEYQYDATGRLVAERNPAYLQVSYHYDGAGRLLNRILSNGSQSDYRYDAAGRLVFLRQRSADGTPVVEVSYDAYDAMGNLLQATTNPTTSPEVATYGYDTAHRLLSVDRPGTADDVAFTYDGVGNRLSEQTAAGTRHSVYGPGNRLLEIRDGSETGPLLRSFTYNDAGEALSKRDGRKNA